MIRLNKKWPLKSIGFIICYRAFGIKSYSKFLNLLHLSDKILKSSILLIFAYFFIKE